MTTTEQKLDEAILLLDELDKTPLGELNRKLDRITEAVVAAKCSLLLLEKKSLP